MPKLITLLFAVIASTTCPAQDIDLSVDLIPDSLLKNANTVTRFEKNMLEVTDINRANIKVHEISTVLNVAGRSKLDFVFESNKFFKLGDFEVKVYDANGKQINRYKKKDLATFNFGEGLIDDAIRNYIIIPAPSYPLTIEFQYDIILKGILQYPRYWISVPSVSVVNSSFTAIVPKELGIRYKAKNTTLEPVKTDDGKTETYVWNVNNRPAILYEDGAVSAGKSYPAILFAPTKFKIDNYEGDMSSWKNYGNWYNTVLAGTDKISEGKKLYYQNMVSGTSSNKEKIKIIYDYLQKNFRYVSIQIGIGGQKPLPADFTDEKKYGDCKGLSNYMYTVLKSLGIKSYLALINRQANDEGVDADFPCDRFNHVILFVPDGKDSIWLECTSKTALFGKLDNTTENRNAILITEKGGVLVATPESESANNTFNVRTTITLDENGSGNCVSGMQGTGSYKDEMLYFLSESKRDDQKAYLVKTIGYKQPDEMLITRITDPIAYNTNITLAIEKVSEFIAGSKMFLAPHIYKFWNYKMPATAKRLRDFYFDVPFLKSDTTIYKLPAGYVVDVMPPGNKFSCETGDFQSSFTFNKSEQAIYSITRLELKKHKITPAQYQPTKAFFDKVLKEEAQRIVIKKGEQEKLKAF